MPCAACTFCGPDTVFDSRNLLFAHLREQHGLIESAASPGKQGEQVALVLAYKGTDLYGSSCHGYHSPGSADDGREASFPTVEGTLLRTIAGAWPPVSFSRCARTDRGVHALHNVISIRLPPLEPGVDEAAWLASVNVALPASVRCVQRLSVRRDFHARRQCDRRTYEYVLPYTALRTAADPVESPLSIRRRLKRVLKQYVGAHDFTRFTRQGAYLQANEIRGGACSQLTLTPTLTPTLTLTLTCRHMIRGGSCSGFTPSATCTRSARRRPTWCSLSQDAPSCSCRCTCIRIRIRIRTHACAHAHAHAHTYTYAHAHAYAQHTCPCTVICKDAPS